MPDEKQIPAERMSDAPPAGAVAELHDQRTRPEGVVPKQGQSYVIAGLAVLILLAVMFSNNRARQTTETFSCHSSNGSHRGQSAQD